MHKRTKSKGNQSDKTASSTTIDPTLIELARVQAERDKFRTELEGLRATVRAAVHDIAMQAPIIQGCPAVPESIQLAERWRKAGETIMRHNPRMFEALCTVLGVAALEANEESITESYLLT